MNTLNFNRIKLLLLADWHEFKLHILLAVIAVPAIALPIMFYNSNIDFDYKMLYLVMMLISASISGNYVHNRANQTKGLGFLVPGSPLDKFSAILIGMGLIFATCNILYISMSLIYSLRITESISNDVFAAIKFFSVGEDMLTMMLLYSYFCLGMITFRKNAFLKTILIIGIFPLIISLFPFERVTMAQFSIYLEWNNYEYVSDNWTHKVENIYPGVLALIEYKNYILSLLILVNTYIGYLKLKEKVL